MKYVPVSIPADQAFGQRLLTLFADEARCFLAHIDGAGEPAA